MKYYISLLLIFLCSWPVMAQGDFNPNNPDEPGPQYFLTVNISPAEAGSVSPSGKNLYTLGQNVYLYTYGNSNYRFKGWMQGNLLINESTSFNYTISTFNAVITAVYEYDPNSPTEPAPIPIRRKLTLASSPQEGGYFNLSSETIFEEGKTITVQAYPNTGYVFDGWQSDGKIISTNSSYAVTFGKTNVALTGIFRFDPVSPPSPNVNSWDATTGELIIDDFTPGYLSSAIDSKIGGSGNRSKVLKITVAGNMNSGDFGIFNGLSSCAEIDLSRVTGVTSIPSYAFYYGSFSKIILPLVTENIEAYAFYGCSNLVEINSYTIDPPVLGANVFGNINGNAILYVLQAAIPGYSNADQWKDLLIMPLSDNVGALTVSLPASANDGMYKNMFLELVNIGTAQKQKFVTTEKLSYTFRGLLTGSKYNVYLKDKNDVLLGEIDNVEITGNDTQAAFSSLLKLYTVTVNVTDKAKANVTSQTAIRWYNADDIFIAQGNSIDGLTADTKLKYSIDLNSELGSQYVQPPQTNYTVSASGNTLSCPLQLIDTVKIQGVVIDDSKSPVSNAVVSVSQMLNGKYTKAITTKTDRYGKYAATVYNDISTITVSASNYISKSVSLTNFNAGLVMDTVKLAAIKGTVITTNFTYTSSVAEGETALKTTGYANYLNVAYTLYNVTKGTAISNFSVQFPSIVLLEPVDAGDQIRITATSKVGEFNPVTCVVTVGADDTATATIDIVELGGINATYTQSANSSNVGILYNSSGQLAMRSDYSNGSVTFKGLADGAYTLVSMANNRLYNSVLNLSELTTSGLVENTDFVKATVSARSGVIKVLTVPVIPTFDEQKLNYTDDNTSFAAGKSSIVVGNYMTLNGRISFKDTYKNNVSNVKMIVDIPEGCSFVDNSIMVGSQVTGSYNIDGSRLTIPLTNYTDLVRFCIIPTQGGSFSPNGFVEFDLNGEVIRQPIGAANFTAQALSISVPSLTAQKTIAVSGAATAKSDIKVYDNDVFVGQTTALANGSWSMSCELNNPYALSYHNIHGEIVTPQGLTLHTETKQVTHNITAVEVSKVTMYYSNPEISKNYELVFDFLNPSTQSQSYTYYIYNKSFTFTIDFTNNSPAVVSNVILYVHTNQGNKIPLTATYDEKKDIWVASSNFGNMYTGELPVNVSVDYLAASTPIFDKSLMKDTEKQYQDMIDSYNSMDSDINSTFAKVDVELSKDNYNVNVVDSIVNALTSKYGINFNPPDDFDSDANLAFLRSLSEEDFDAYGDKLENEITNTIDSLNTHLEYFNGFENQPKYFDYTLDNGQKISVKTCDGINESNLINLGFEKALTSEGKYVYIKIDENEIAYIDFEANIYVTQSISDLLRSIELRNGTGLYGVCDFVTNWISPIYDWIDGFKSKYDEISNYIISNSKFYENYSKLLTQQLANANNYLRMSKDPAKITKWTKEIAILEKEAAHNGKVLTFFKDFNLDKYLPYVDIISYAYDAVSILNDFCKIYMLIPPDCPANESLAESLRSKTVLYGGEVGAFWIGTVAASIGTDALVTYAILQSGGSLLVAGGSILGLKVGAMSWLNSKFDSFKNDKIANLRGMISNLTCIKDTLEPPQPPCLPLIITIDPSGYVYETVPSNRLQGVTTTAYYKSWVENMYGDREEQVVLWDASDYNQNNPLLTDENGMYAWDVPAGLWQVKYEKDGYQTTYSDWLPVPPPQLDINVAMVQASQPYVQTVQGYESGIAIEFNKYMLPATLTSDQIIVTRNGEVVTGTIQMVNEETAPNGEDSFVSKVRFIPDQPFAVTDKVILSVSRKVQSYAGISMESDFMQQIDIEKEINAINVVPSIDMEDNDSQIIQVSVEPKEAAAGKKIIARSASSSIAGVTPEAVLNTEGVAMLQINSELPGTTQITVSVEGIDLKANVTVNVAMPKVVMQQLDKPTASVPSGSTVEKNSTVSLSSNTEGAIIYYTMDGSSPNETGRLEYTQPIAITKDITIKAIASKEGMLDSEIATFEYSVKVVMQQLDKPTASVSSGSTVEENSTVSLASNTEGAVIYYTQDGSSPYETGRLEYTQPVVITKDITIQAIASKESMLDSEIATFEYFVKVMEQVAKPTASLSSDSTVEKNTMITLSSNTTGATIYYTLDGSEPSATSGLEYTQPIVITDDVTIRAMAVKEGMSNSEIAVFEYHVSVTGIPDVKATPQYRMIISPNPVRVGESFIVKFDIPGDALKDFHIVIYSVLGEKVYENHRLTPVVEIKGLRQGSYIVRLSDANNVNYQTRKLIVIN